MYNIISLDKVSGNTLILYPLSNTVQKNQVRVQIWLNMANSALLLYISADYYFFTTLVGATSHLTFSAKLMLYISETCIPVHSCLAIFCALHFFHQVADRRDSSLHWSPSHKGQGTLAQNPYETNSIQFLKYYYIILYYIHGRVAYRGGGTGILPPLL